MPGRMRISAHREVDVQLHEPDVAVQPVQQVAEQPSAMPGI